MIKGFKDFIMRGNVVDLAVAVVIGTAFGFVVAALVRDIITPIIGIFGGAPDFGTLSLSINSSKFMYGDFINVLISFVLIAAAIYFVVVVPMQKVQARTAKPVEVTTKDCLECLSSIPLAATRCAFCTALQPVEAAS